TSSDRKWFQTLITYLRDSSRTSAINWAYWSWNPDSGDTGGLLHDDWVTVDNAKNAALTTIKGPPKKDVGGTVTIAPTPTTTGPEPPDTSVVTPAGGIQVLYRNSGNTS